MIANPVKKLAFKAALAPFSVAARLFPKQANEFGFFIDHFTFMAGLLYAAAHGPGRWLTLRRAAATAQ